MSEITAAIAWNDQQAREALVDALVTDAHRVLGHLPDQELGPKAADAVALLEDEAGFRAAANDVLRRVHERMRHEDRDFYPRVEAQHAAAAAC